jgi:hypothetical protein
MDHHEVSESTTLLNLLPAVVVEGWRLLVAKESSGASLRVRQECESREGWREVVQCSKPTTNRCGGRRG